MKHRLSGTIVLAAVLLAGPLHAQKATERYIPIGESPGVSGKLSYMGRIERVDPRNRTVTVSGPQGERTIEITDDTRIWIDRTARHETCVNGGIGDLEPGRRIEVKYVDATTRYAAEWIKVALR